MIPAIICILIGIIEWRVVEGSLKQIPNAKVTEGRICHLEYKYKIPSVGHGIVYYATVRYFIEGVEYYVKTKYASNFGMNHKIIVKYNEKNPSQAVATHTLGTLLGSFIWIAFGIYIILSEVLGLIPSIFS